MNKQQAKRVAWGIAYRILESSDLKVDGSGVLYHLNEADRNRVLDAFDEVTQHCFDRHTGNMVRARGY